LPIAGKKRRKRCRYGSLKKRKSNRGSGKRGSEGGKPQRVILGEERKSLFNPGGRPRVDLPTLRKGEMGERKGKVCNQETPGSSREPVIKLDGRTTTSRLAFYKRAEKQKKPLKRGTNTLYQKVTDGSLKRLAGFRVRGCKIGYGRDTSRGGGKSTSREKIVKEHCQQCSNPSRSKLIYESSRGKRRTARGRGSRLTPIADRPIAT